MKKKILLPPPNLFLLGFFFFLNNLGATREEGIIDAKSYFCVH